LPPSRQDSSGGAFLLQLVKGNVASLESGESDTFQQLRSTNEKGAALLRQLRGEPGPTIPFEGTTGDQAAERGKALLMQLLSPGNGNGGKGNESLLAEPGKKVNSTSKTKAINDLHAKKRTAMSETKGLHGAQEWEAGDDRGAYKGYARNNRAKAVTARVGTAATTRGMDGDGLGAGQSGGVDRRQRAVASSWVDESKHAAEAQTWGKTRGEARRIRGERPSNSWGTKRM